MPAQTYTATVERIAQLTSNVKHFRLKLPPAPALSFTPGQFMIVNVPYQGQTLKRAYSIASPPHDAGALEFCIQIVEGGRASGYFDRLREGDAISINGPHGKFTLKEPVTYKLVFMSTGTGIAPFRSMMHHLAHQGHRGDIWNFLGIRYDHSVLYRQEFEELQQQHPNMRFIPTVSRPEKWQGERGHIQQVFQKYITDYINTEIYVCGWIEIVKKIVADLKSFGVPEQQIHFEEW